jgi:hypothetical protein
MPVRRTCGGRTPRAGGGAPKIRTPSINRLPNNSCRPRARGSGVRCEARRGGTWCTPPNREGAGAPEGETLHAPPEAPSREVTLAQDAARVVRRSRSVMCRTSCRVKWPRVPRGPLEEGRRRPSEPRQGLDSPGIEPILSVRGGKGRKAKGKRTFLRGEGIDSADCPDILPPQRERAIFARFIGRVGGVNGGGCAGA